MGAHDRMYKFFSEEFVDHPSASIRKWNDSTFGDQRNTAEIKSLLALVALVLASSLSVRAILYGRELVESAVAKQEMSAVASMVSDLLNQETEAIEQAKENMRQLSATVR